MMPKGRLSARESELRSKCASGKRRFRSEEQAQRALDNDIARREAGNVQRREQRVYQCAGDYTCGGYHLTSKAQLTEPRPPLRARSAKTAALYRTQRIPFVIQMIAEFPVCQIQWDQRCTQRATTVHELRKRSQGGSTVLRENCVTSCSFCNGIIEDYPVEAHARGFVLWAGESA